MSGSEEIFNRAMNDGHSAAWDKNWSKAARAYLQALDEFPSSQKALNSYALAQYQLQHYDEALKAYIRSARVAPDDPLAFEKIAQINIGMGKNNEAIQAALFAAEQYLKLRDVEKAIENWLIVIQVSPENLQARSRLALIHEKTGQIRQASFDYIAVASILQNTGNPQKAFEVLKRALELDPGSGELQQAIKFVGSGKILPKPINSKGVTGSLFTRQPMQLPTSEEAAESPNPVVEASKKALKVFADVLFNMEDDSSEAVMRRGLATIEKINTGQLNSQQVEQSKIPLYLSETITAHSRENDQVAITELGHAIQAGWTNPAAYFDMGLLLSKTEQQDNALRNLQQCYRHGDYAMAARLLSGKILRGLKNEKQAAIEYLEALKLADGSVVDADQAEPLLQLYEPLVEAVEREKDIRAQTKLCDNVEEMLMRANWRQHLRKLRSEMPKSGEQLMPIAEIIIQAQSSRVIEAMKDINELARTNYLRSAIDEAFHTLMYAPSYLPLHVLIAELLIRDGRKADAISKFAVVANAYSVRGEGVQASSILRRVIQLSPMDLASRNRLIELLSARGQVDDAIKEYFDLADIYYRLAELDLARKTLSSALRLAQQPDVNRAWSVKILQRMADIDMQRLDWRQAVRVHEQIRNLIPDDLNTREALIELHLRLSQASQAEAELETLVGYLEVSKKEQIIPFLKKMLEQHPDQLMFSHLLAKELHKQGQTSQAIELLDAVGDRLMKAGDKSGLTAVVNQILLMEPPNAEDYRTLLAQL
ncbi:MAG TPA: tetratricopeptide repeat protein [Anaerolineales bacterium]|jgi:tetratricopeptide (TPR) repeat protein